MEQKQDTPRVLTRREVLKYGVYGGLAAGITGGLWMGGCKRDKEDKGPQPRPSKRPNLVFIVIDTLRADHCGSYGYPRNTTPNLDALGREGFLFRNAISSAPWTSPSIANMLTSQYPHVLGIRKTASTMDPRFPLLSEVLREHGYETHGIVSHSMLGPQIGFSRGFDAYDWASSKGAHIRATSPEVSAKAIRFLKAKHNRPFFLFLHYFDPHANFLFHEGHDFNPSGHGAYTGRLVSNFPLKKLWRIRRELSATDLLYLVSLYDSEIAFTDEHVGRVLEALRQQGLYDNSAIVITADHGEEFMERDWIGHFTTLYQEVLHVPLVMKFPDVKPRTIDLPVGLIDVMPTLLQYLKVPIPETLDGKALNLDPGGAVASRPIFSETFTDVRQKFAKEEGLPPEQPIALKSIVLGRRKLIYDEQTESRNVYDLSTDPKERNNLWAQRSPEDKRLALLLSQWMEYVAKKRQKGPEVNENELFTPEQREELKSMGYL
jgi:arylsulfatase A-like enzyme